MPAPSSQKVHVSQSGLGLVLFLLRQQRPAHILSSLYLCNGHSEPASSGEANQEIC